MNQRKKIGFIVLTLGICSLLSGGYWFLEKSSIAPATVTVSHLEYQEQATTNLKSGVSTWYGWLMMIGLTAITAGSQMFRANKPSTTRITLDFRDKRNY